MKLKVIALAALLAMTSTSAIAQNPGNTAGGSSKAGGTAATLPNSATRGHGGMRMRMGWHRHHHHYRHHHSHYE